MVNNLATATRVQLIAIAASLCLAIKGLVRSEVVADIQGRQRYNALALPMVKSSWPALAERYKGFRFTSWPTRVNREPTRRYIGVKRAKYNAIPETKDDGPRAYDLAMMSLDEYTEMMGDGFSVSEPTTEEVSFLPDGAPKDWSKFIERATLAVHTARNQRAEFHSEEILPYDPELDYGEFDRDETRWETPGTPLDDYWASDTAVIDSRGKQGDRERYLGLEFSLDSEPGCRASEMREAARVSRSDLATTWTALQKVPDYCEPNLDLLAHIAKHGTVGAVLQNAYCEERDLASQRMMKRDSSLEIVDRPTEKTAKLARKTPLGTYIIRHATSEESAHMANGRQSRVEFYWELREMFARGRYLLQRGRPMGLAFLSWLLGFTCDCCKGSDCGAVPGWGDIEAANTYSYQTRGAQDEHNRPLTMGREYILTRDMMDGLTRRRKNILGAFPTKRGLSRELAAQWRDTYQRKFQGLHSVSGHGSGTRASRPDFGPECIGKRRDKRYPESWEKSKKAQAAATKATKEKEAGRAGLRAMIYVAGEVKYL